MSWCHRDANGFQHAGATELPQDIDGIQLVGPLVRIGFDATYVAWCKNHGTLESGLRNTLDSGALKKNISVEYVYIYICTWELWVREFIMKWGLNLFEVICWRVQGWGYRFQFQCFVAFIWVDALRGARQSDKSSWLLAGLDLDINLFLYCRQMCRGLLTAYLRLKNHQSWWALLLMKQTWHWS